MGELLDGALSLIRSNPKTVLGLAAVVSAISAILQTIGVWASLAILDSPAAGDLESGLDTEGLALIGASLIVQLIPSLVAGFLQVLAGGLFIVLVAAAVLGHKLDASATWKLLRPRFGPLVVLTIALAGAALAIIAAVTGAAVAFTLALGEWGILIGALLALTTAILVAFAYVRLAVASPVLVIENRGPIASLRRSWRLVKGSWWRTLGILLLSAIITNLLATVVSVPVGLVAGVASGFSESYVPTVLAAGLATLISGIIVLPFTAAVTGLLYTDLRMRREALDIELVAAGTQPDADPLAAYRRNLQ